jgi:hypothetical protein
MAGAGSASWQPENPDGTPASATLENFNMFRVRNRAVWCRVPNLIIKGKIVDLTYLFIPRWQLWG